MPSYLVKFRATTAWQEQTIDAESREQAVHDVLDAIPEGSEGEVCSVIETEKEPEIEPPARAAVASTGAKRESHRGRE